MTSATEADVVAQEKGTPMPGSRLRHRSLPGLVLRELCGGLVPIGVVLLLWQVAYVALPANSFLRSPVEAIRYAAEPGTLDRLAVALGSTFAMVVLGYAIAIAVSIVLASVVVSSMVLARALMPVAVLLGTIPVIVISPVVIMLVGRSPATSVTVCVLITFFPALVNIVSAMGSVPPTLLDLCGVLGGGRMRTLVSVRLPRAVPGLVSAGKLGLPAALTGVILTEYIATGAGIGTYINLARANYWYVEMWAGILAVLVCSVLVYTVLGVLETVLQDRYVASGRGDR
ncbi:ABC transporter permease [Dactylosporangium sucinum]|uniref:ABC transporter permease n=1 Tax=Dactylosporangium sucinum TaxID=1424081 RepID=A0A917X6Y5_9ACTN|nr:ABC transporter permease subunit [Dactylosporangium sucinum]GGM81383.1 ABC transporter permease [Dactylosporangium sucinum]